MDYIINTGSALTFELKTAGVTDVEKKLVSDVLSISDRVVLQPVEWRI